MKTASGDRYFSVEEKINIWKKILDIKCKRKYNFVVKYCK